VSFTSKVNIYYIANSLYNDQKFSAHTAVIKRFDCIYIRK